jgi:hypothetical protein
MFTGLATLCAGMSWLYFRVERGIREEKFWAWVTALILSGVCLFSIFLPMSVLVIIGLCHPHVRGKFMASQPTPADYHD